MSVYSHAARPLALDRASLDAQPEPLGEGMRFGVLGPLLVRDGHSVVVVRAARQRVLLAALTLRAGQPVSADELAEAVWSGAVPSRANATLREYVMRLRRALGPAARARIVTRQPGYLLDAAEDEVDVARFASLCRAGGALVRAGDWAKAAGLLGEALGLWRGTPLADVRSETLRQAEVPRLEQLRLQALEWRMDAGLALGHHSELASELAELAAQEPLRERFHAQLMLALYRSGRRTEALAAYQLARGILVGELGVEPGAELRDLHERMQAADPALTIGRATTAAGVNMSPAGRRLPVVPQELPAPVTHFAGRDAELAALTDLLEAGERATAVVGSAIGGMAGVGKTALAVHWAHQVADRFPDGQLYVDLRGYDPDEPMPPADALAGFLRSLGVTGHIPADTAERAARYRSLLAGRRVLVILDNAGHVEQVRPLLPASPGCMMVVTSRDSLPGLVARDGVTRLDLDLLPPAEATGLLHELIGARVRAEPGAAGTLASQCGHLPLALRIAAELAATRPATLLSDVVGELGDHQRRLDLLDAGGDPRVAVRAVFSWSYQKLDSQQARLFRLLGMHPGPDFDRYAAAALTGAPLTSTARALDVLCRAYLIQTLATGRFAMHDLVRAYARELTATHDSQEDRRAARYRLFDHYLHTVAAAMDSLFPAEAHRRPHVPVPATPVPPVADPADARAWLDSQRSNLTALGAASATSGSPSHATRGVITVWRYLERGGYFSELTAQSHYALLAAQRTGDRHAQAELLNIAGTADIAQGGHQQAASHLQQALALTRETGDRAGQARALASLGHLDILAGRYASAASRLAQALALFRATGDRFGEASALIHTGVLDLRQGRLDQAGRHLHRALALSREIADPDGEADALANLGIARLRQSRHASAARLLEQALASFRARANPTGEACVLAALGSLELRRVNYRQAVSYLEQAVALFHQTGGRPGEAVARNGLGEVLLASGQPGNARTQFTAALAAATESGEKYEQARAHQGLARAQDTEAGAGHEPA